MGKHLLKVPFGRLLQEHPYAGDYFRSIGLSWKDSLQTPEQLIESVEEETMEDAGLSHEQMRTHFLEFMAQAAELMKNSKRRLSSLTIIGGTDKSGREENVEIELRPGDIMCIVGPTGSGKSRLLADIECFAQKDTPTGRTILIDGKTPTQNERFRFENKLVAQLSQNMNFVVDLNVESFVAMHASSRMVVDIDSTVQSVIECANELAGEKFERKTALTQLSGGQSRALMIADTALLSSSPIVLIDEIENAGVDRKKALELLVRKEKIVLMSTHDPILALMGNRRIAISNGGIAALIDTEGKEKENLAVLEEFDAKILEIRNMLRSGKKIDFELGEFLGLAEKTV
ncbi:ABC transporter ATP-binding protein [Geovibrio sp. ADMFC3]|jgi:ABC-type lipoprotein export system ATPase subunit